jgi:ABC-type bacteriocin/lantibiotic exporter with double-glycine peptidase domain
MSTTDKNQSADPGKSELSRPAIRKIGPTGLPRNLFRYVLEDSGLHQLFLAALAAGVFLLEFVPLELTRRIINDVTKHRDFRLIVLLGAFYFAVILVQGSTKLALNVYRGWVSERATRNLRNRILAITETSAAGPLSLEATGTELSMVVAEVEPIGAFVSECISEPLLQIGVLLCLLAYMIHVELGIAIVAFILFVPQLIFVPAMQSAINWRTKTRVSILREVSASVVGPHDKGTAFLDESALRTERVFQLGMGIFRFKFTMNFLMNLCSHGQIIGILLVGGWYVYTDRLAIGGVVAFISAVSRLNDPWGDLVNYFRDLSSTQVRYRLMAEAVGPI